MKAAMPLAFLTAAVAASAFMSTTVAAPANDAQVGHEHPEAEQAQMKREELRGPDGRLLGWRLQEGSRIKGHTAEGRLRGWYENGRTYDASGRLVGSGDLLTTLIVTR